MADKEEDPSSTMTTELKAGDATLEAPSEHAAQARSQQGDAGATGNVSNNVQPESVTDASIADDRKNNDIHNKVPDGDGDSGVACVDGDVANTENNDDNKGEKGNPQDRVVGDTDADAPVDSPPETDDGIGSSKGAKILMNRFSTWRQKANENAQTLWSNNKSVIPSMSNMTTVSSSFNIISERLSTMDGAPSEPKTPVANNSDEKAENETEKNNNEAGKTETTTTSQIENDEKGNSTPKKPTNNSNGEQPEARVAVGVAVAKAAAAASVVAESVATGFRGRYSSATTSVDSSPRHSMERPNRRVPESQTALILKSRVAKHMQAILNSLQDHEFAMLLGNGMLGVNLKQCYLKNHGVFVDFLVPDGQAHNSGVIRTGDLVLKVGDLDVRKGTIVDIPKQIAQARRPVVLIMATGTKTQVEKMNYIDISVALMHRVRFREEGGLLRQDTAESIEEDVVNGEVSFDQSRQAQQSSGQDKQREPLAVSEDSVTTVEVPIDTTLNGYSTPPIPPLDLRKELVDEVAQRCNDDFEIAELCQAMGADKNFRAAVRNAFLTCALDSRKLTFLTRHFSSEDQEIQTDAKMAPGALLMLFLELRTFFDLYGVTPASRLRDITSRIAQKFFLPNRVGKTLQPPLFDFHHIVPDSSLRHLEFVLGGNSGKIPRGVFLDFQNAVVDSLAGPPFVSFLASRECSRMRAYLRNTAPYFNLPLGDLFESFVGDTKRSGAQNYFTYVILFLLCQLDKEPSGENDFVTSGQVGSRILGASAGMCCAIYIRKVLLPTLQDVQQKVKDDPNVSLDAQDGKLVIEQCEKFWSIYLSKGGGALEGFPKSNEAEASFVSVRSLFKEAVGNFPNQKKMVETIIDDKILSELRNLADELLYHYAADVHSKFREHKLHEWMCNELTKTRWTPGKELPVLPQGCIKRLLRRVELPVGVSTHKPVRSSPTFDGKSGNNSNEPENNYPNADYAIIFGSSVGNELAGQMPIPAISDTDIRRYTCVPIALDRDHLQDSFQEEPIPTTFESYAVAPTSSSRKVFSRSFENIRQSSDGWNVTLFNFTIPNAESSGDESDSALYGVSLVFTQVSSDGIVTSTTPTKTQLVVKGSNEESKNEQTTENKTEESEAEEKKDSIDDEKPVAGDFVSPIYYEVEASSNHDPVEENEGANDGLKSYVRNVKVSDATPIVNEKLSTHPWIERATKEEYRDQQKPLKIGIALACRRNVILAMRSSLSLLLKDYSTPPPGGEKEESDKDSFSCAALVELLGAHSFQDVESFSLRCILEPYIRAGSAPWIERPLKDQSNEFEKLAVKSLTECLPPIPLTLMLVTALLEQKIVLSSCRRSVLHFASVGLAALMKPLKWCHLLVPLVPSSLAGDLMQYPAPFILGLPSEDGNNMELLNTLPRDVTLVDLDVGRVILAPAFGHDNEMVRGTPDAEVTARALRSQVLYLAQSLGCVLGTSLLKNSWGCDSPFLGNPQDVTKQNNANSHDGLDKFLATTRSFIDELLEGTCASCYWIEETTVGYGTTEEPTVLFDEEHFFQIKNLRALQCHDPLLNDKAPELVLSLDDFDLVLESFLRCQTMSAYICSQSRKKMAYY